MFQSTFVCFLSFLLIQIVVDQKYFPNRIEDAESEDDKEKPNVAEMYNTSVGKSRKARNSDENVTDIIILSEDFGYISSPNYPKNYENNVIRRWKIEVNPGYQIKIHFSHFDLEPDSSCTYDNLLIYDESRTFLKEFCGNITPSDIVSPSNKLYIDFNSDNTVVRQGFKLDYVAITDTVELKESYGEIRSPNNPNYYESNMTRRWMIDVKSGYKIKIRFDGFNFQPGSDCQYDKLQIYDETRTFFYIFCGSTIPADILFSSNKLYIDFKSDGSEVYQGFHLRYITIPDTVELRGHSGSIRSPNFPNNYENNKFRKWVIEVEPGYKIKIVFWYFNLQPGSNCQYDNLQIYDETGIFHRKFCGNITPPVILSPSNKLYIDFKSDGSEVDKGFDLYYRTSCSGQVVLTETADFISSPIYYSSSSLNDRICTWLIRISPGYQLNFTFNKFTLQQHPNCSFDSLEIYNGPSGNAPLLGKFCGEVLPSDIQASSNEVYIRFNTNWAIESNTSFVLQYRMSCSCGDGHTCYYEKGIATCVCRENFSENNGICAECNCGPGHSCEFCSGKKTCMCLQGYAENNGICQECFCGKNSSCVFNGGENVCLCSKGFAQKDGKCAECLCGTNSSCHFEAGKKTCHCKDGSAEKEGNCEECFCGNSSTCHFEVEKKTCHCKYGFAEKEGNCEECFCGNTSTCHFEAGVKICHCKDGFAEKEGNCEECFCGNNSTCHFEAGEKMCHCKDGHAEKEGNCEECGCGHGHKCHFAKGSVTCLCSKNFLENDGICVECFCGDGHECEIREGNKFCVCSDDYAENNGTCEECNCGSGHSCEFDNGIKSCRCSQGHAENNGMCQECSCGGNHLCVFEGDKKRCLCPKHHVEHAGKCKECFCGEDHSCGIIADQKVCVCIGTYKESDGICKKCFCGENSSCFFDAGVKLCFCSKGYVQKDGKCEDCSCGNNISCKFDADEKTCHCSKGQIQKDGKCENSALSVLPNIVFSTTPS